MNYTINFAAPAGGCNASSGKLRYDDDAAVGGGGVAKPLAIYKKVADNFEKGLKCMD